MKMTKLRTGLSLAVCVSSVVGADENTTFNTRRKAEKQYVYTPPVNEVKLDQPIPPLPRDQLFELKLMPHDRNEPDVWPRKITNLGRLFIGTDPDSYFDVVLDTGSAHLVIPSINCPSPACERHRQFDVSTSVTARDVNADGTAVRPGEGRDEVTVHFGSGRIHGHIVDDRVCTGTLCGRTDVVTATEMSDTPFLKFPFDGILGLGLEALSINPNFNFLTRVFEPQRLPRILSLFLSEEIEHAGELTMGGWKKEWIRPDFNNQEPVWVPIVRPEQGHWQVKIERMIVGNTVLPVCAEIGEDCYASADSGSRLLGMPPAIYRETISTFQKELSPEQLCDGSRPEYMPTLTLDLGDAMVHFTADEYTRRMNTTQAGCDYAFMQVSMPAPVGPNFFVLGHGIFNRYLTMFDGEQSRVGFAIQKPRPGASPSVHKNLPIPPPLHSADGILRTSDGNEFDGYLTNLPQHGSYEYPELQAEEAFYI